MNHRGRIVAMLVAAMLLAAACVADPAASPDPSSSAPAATAVADGSPAASAAACPAPLPIDPATGAMVASVEALAVLGDAAAACYGDARLQATAYVPAEFQGGYASGYTYTPAWLYGEADVAFLASHRGAEEQWLVVRVPPSLGACAGTQMSTDCVLHQYAGRWIAIVGHYNDPASATCVATPIPDPDPAPPISAAASEAACRTHFVLDSFTQVVATGDVPPVDPGLCPVEPITIGQLAAGEASIGPEYGLACLGPKELTLTAYVVPGVGLLSGMEQDTFDPRWLADPLNTGIVLAATAAASEDPASWLVARVPPDLIGDGGVHACDGSAVDPASCPFAPHVGAYVTITAHYDDAQSMTCRIVDPADVTPSLTPDEVILSCREQLVVDSVRAAAGPESTPPPTSTEIVR